MIKRMNTTLVSLTALSLALVTMMPATAAAQDAEDAEDTEGAETPNDDGLETIIVTAERREVNLQDVPSAATAMVGSRCSPGCPPSTRSLAPQLPPAGRWAR